MADLDVNAPAPELASTSSLKRKFASYGAPTKAGGSLLQQFITVLEAEDPDGVILSTKIIPRPAIPSSSVRQAPKRTRASEAAAAAAAIAAAVAASSTDNIKEEKPTTETVSILEKLRLGGYRPTEDSTGADAVVDESEAIQDLRDDLKLAAQRVIATLAPSSEMYQRIDRFFYYAESLFARCIRPAGKEIEALVEASAAADAANAAAKAAAAASVGEDGLASAAATTTTIDERGEDKEVLYMVSQHGPLFSSLSKKSRIDPREFEVPAFFNTTKIVPLRPGTATNRRLGMLSPSPYHALTGSAPAVAAKLRPLLSDFTHPVNEPLPTARWIKYDAYSSFAPTKDEVQTIVSGETAAMVWYDRYARKIRRRQEVAKKRAESSVPETPAEAGAGESKGESETATATASEAVEKDGESETVGESGESGEKNEGEDDNSAIDPELIKDWLESESSREYDNVTLTTIASWLERLQELQIERFKQPPPAAPLVIPGHVYQNPQQMMQMQLQQAQQQQFYIEGPAVSQEEKELVRKVQYALSEMVSQLPPYLVADSVSRWIPTLAKSTVGSLPPDASAEMAGLMPAGQQQQQQQQQSPAGGSGRRRR
ncbi:hypothetical protein BZA70DRAFT_278796 [Myxozyma melibiosi]|uniref:Uncharacterized protein n=1 Tax=Myxozyma melibiosi TaxID=54550 RepID=A0ABR1F579_9ASCO